MERAVRVTVLPMLMEAGETCENCGIELESLQVLSCPALTLTPAPRLFVPL
jgi:hypothetical protein